MKRFFVTNLFFLLTLNILIKSFWILGIDREVQNALSADVYGMYYALFNFTYLFNIILDFGITNYNNRTIAQHTQLLKKYFARIVPLKFALAAIYFVIILIVGAFLGYSSYQIKLLSWMCITQVLQSFISYLRSNITSLMLFKTDSVISVLDRSLLIVFCGIFLWNDSLRAIFTIDHFVYIQTLTMFITFLVALIVCLSKTRLLKLKWNFAFNLHILKDGLPYALLGLLMACYNRMDSVMLLALVEDNGVSSGIYASGFRLVDSANMVAYLFSVILLPLIAKMIKENQKLIDRTYTTEDNVTIEDQTADNGYIYLALTAADGSDMAAFFFFAEETDEDIIVPVGVYPIDSSEEYGTVYANPGVQGDGVWPSYYARMLEDGQLITPLWLLVDGTVEVTKTEDGKPYLEVNAVNSYGVEVHIVFDGTVTGLENINVNVEGLRKQIIDGQLVIIRNGKAYNAQGSHVK